MAKRALQASFGNEEIAAQYCIDGIPEDLNFSHFESGDDGGGGAEVGDDVDPSIVDNLTDDQLRQLASMGGGGLATLTGGGLAAPGAGAGRGMGRGGGAVGGLGRGLGGLGGTGGADGGAGAGTGTGTGGVAPLIPNLDSLLAQTQNPFGHLPPAAQQLLQDLANNPQLMQLRQILQQNPGQTETVLRALVQNNPQLQPILQAYPSEFLSVLTGRHVPPMGGAGRGGGAGGGTGMGMDGPASGGVFGDNTMQFRRSPNGQLAVALSPEDTANVDSIKQITGKPDALVIEAYVACGKNVENTINFLYDM